MSSMILTDNVNDGVLELGVAPRRERLVITNFTLQKEHIEMLAKLGELWETSKSGAIRRIIREWSSDKLGESQT